MLDWTDIKLLAALAAGTVLAVLTSTAERWRDRAFCVAAGLAAGFFGTEPLIAWAGQAFAQSGFPYLICGALAMTGDRITRRIIQAVETVRLPWPRK